MNQDDKEKIRRHPPPFPAAAGKGGAFLLRRLAAGADRGKLWRDGDRILVAVSGGLDSVALLHLLRRLSGERRLDLTVVHLDHGLRGEASAADRRWVEELAARLGLPCVSGHRDAGAGRKEYSPEEAARRVRYDFFREVSTRTGIAILALGHQADDQAETVLLRLLRGSRPAGLAGMAPSRREGDLLLIRPLLPFRREELRAFLAEIGEDFREDLSNRDSRFLRNRLRRHLLPLLEAEYSPRCRELLLELARQEREREDYLHGRLEERCRELIRETAAGPALETRLFGQAAPLERGEALRRLLGRAGVCHPHRRHFGALERLAEGPSGRRLDLPGAITAVREGGFLLLSPRRVAGTLPVLTLEIPGEVILEAISARIVARPRPAPEGGLIQAADLRGYWEGYPGSGPRREFLDRDRVVPPLTVRSRRPGDRYRPLGLAGSKKIKEILNEAGVPLSRRGLIPVVEDREKILWLAGHRPEHSCRVRPDTGEILEISLEPIPSPRGR